MNSSAPPPAPILLAVDPSLRSTGYAVLREVTPGKASALEYGAIVNHRNFSQTECLTRIFTTIRDIVDKYHPAACAMEGVIFVQSHRTAITLGAARAAAILPVSMAKIPIEEYAPRKVKQAVVGRGAADKSQVAFMVRALLSLTETPQSDAADALAIGITHYQSTASPLTRSGSRQEL